MDESCRNISSKLDKPIHVTFFLGFMIVDHSPFTLMKDLDVIWISGNVFDPFTYLRTHLRTTKGTCTW